MPRHRPAHRRFESAASHWSAAFASATSVLSETSAAPARSPSGRILRATVGSVVHAWTTRGTDDRDEMPLFVDGEHPLARTGARAHVRRPQQEPRDPALPARAAPGPA